MRYRWRVMKKVTNRPRFPLLSIALAAIPLWLGNLSAAAQAPAPDSPAIEEQAHAMLAKLTLEQKIELLGGIDSMFTRPMPAIDLPSFKMSDASVGVRTWGPTTAYAGGVALAASWDPDLARKIGESLGRDARARSVNFLLGPGVNIARSPLNGRNFEYLSEDPFLNATLVVPFIEGVQSQGVVATVKHYALNNSEYNRHNIDAEVDERTMREIYLPAFEAAVTKAHVDAVMDSYNLVNGVHSTQNDFLNVKVLKGEWGFQGVLMSDWDATYDGVAACNNGLDLEMPSPKFMNAKNLLPAVQSGAVKEATIDDHVLRLFRTELRYGFTTRPQFDPADSTYSVADRALRRRKLLKASPSSKTRAIFCRSIRRKSKTSPSSALTPGPQSPAAEAPPMLKPSSRSAFLPASLTCSVPMRMSSTAPACQTRRMKRKPSSRPTLRRRCRLRQQTEGEGHDRTFTLPPGQDALIEEAVAANPHTIVLLTAGGGVDTSRWLDKVPVLLHALVSRPGRRHGGRANPLWQARP